MLDTFNSLSADQQSKDLILGAEGKKVPVVSGGMVDALNKNRMLLKLKVVCGGNTNAEK